MINNNRFFAGSFVGIMCLTLCFGGLTAVPSGTTFLFAVSLAILIVLFIAASFLLYRTPVESKRFTFWPLVALTAPALITLSISLVNAAGHFGTLFVSIGCVLWLVVSLTGFLCTGKVQGVRSDTVTRVIPVAAALGAVVPSILSAFGVLDREAFVSVFCYFALACGLSFTVASLFRAILRGM